MKKTVLFLAAVACLALAPSADVSAQQSTQYGKTLPSKKVYTAPELVTALGKKTPMKDVVVKGTISQVCQAEGCWMKLKNEAGEDVFVKFKDHAFLVPKDISGKNAIVYGTASKKVISVDERRHLAEDAGMAPSDIDAINTPKEEIRIDAIGVQVL